MTVPSIIIFLNLIMQEGQTILNEYQLDRIMAWLNPAEYGDDAYQQQNSIMPSDPEQLYGKGLYNNDISSLKNGNFIVEPQTDFIFAVTGEELGFHRMCGSHHSVDADRVGMSLDRKKCQRSGRE